MILRAQQTFDKVYLDRENPSDFIKRELVNKLMDELEDHEIHFIELKKQEFIEDFPTTRESTIAQDLVCEKVVQCKNCRMHFPWCYKFRTELGGIGFCPYGNIWKGV